MQERDWFMESNLRFATSYRETSNVYSMEMEISLFDLEHLSKSGAIRKARAKRRRSPTSHDVSQLYVRLGCEVKKRLDCSTIEMSIQRSSIRLRSLLGNCVTHLFPAINFSPADHLSKWRHFRFWKPCRDLYLVIAQFFYARARAHAWV